MRDRRAAPLMASIMALIVLSIAVTAVAAEDVQVGVTDIGDTEVQEWGDYTATWVYLVLLSLFGLLSFIGGYVYHKAGGE